MMRLFLLLLIAQASISCNYINNPTPQIPQKENSIVCSDHSCQGKYIGPEFTNGSDVAHQFSNTMSRIVGDQLKALYKEGSYTQVDFTNIIMTTQGMGSGQVTYYLSIPFKRVFNKCEAYTSFDHVGGWNHTPALPQRKTQLAILLPDNDQLNISDLNKTPEGLEEYWIQWRHKEIQSNCP